MSNAIESFRAIYSRRELLTELVKRDVRLKYRRSFLGYLWSIMNPLLMMIVLTIVFARMFRYDIVNYPIYLIIGRSMFDFMNECTNAGMRSIVSNAALLKKTYVPKYIFTLASVTSSTVNFIFSLGALVIVMIATKTIPSVYTVFLPLTIILFYIFCLGISLFLASVTVFFRDIEYIYRALLTAWMYLSAIFYPITRLPESIRDLVVNFNPIFIYIEQARSLILYGKLPTPHNIGASIVFALISITIGVAVFKKTQDNFILYI
ncbi:MAG: ABC transporter permease [Synergistes sp.]|nr:ABC transporter permease [Synergistes sp.]MCR5335928.1 ABC transporter permease [Synergistes sp.]